MGFTPERFQENPAFVRYLQNLISTRVREVEGIRRAAHQQGEGYVYLVDARTPQPDAQVPPADIIGALKVQTGTPVAASYRPNPNHRLLTKDAFSGFLVRAQRPRRHRGGTVRAHAGASSRGPSAVRGRHCAEPSVRGKSFDAAMAAATIHHWQDPIAGYRAQSHRM